MSDLILGTENQADYPTLLVTKINDSTLQLWNFGGRCLQSHSEHEVGVAAQSTNFIGLYAHSKNYDGVLAHSDNGHAVIGVSTNGFAGFFFGPLANTGGKSAAVPHPDGSHRLLFSMESPESWFEDFGTGRLLRGGCRVKLDRDFAAVVRTGHYHVFLQAEGDSKGLYVASKNTKGFEVREQSGGNSTINFSYRIVALRKDIPIQRMPKVKLPSLTPPTLQRPKRRQAADKR